MRQVSYEDAKGRKFMVLLPDDVPDWDAHRGIPLGPPDLGPLDLPEEVEIRLNHQLFARSLFTARDLRYRPNEVQAALMAALKVSAQKLWALYPDMVAAR